MTARRAALDAVAAIRTIESEEDGIPPASWCWAVGQCCYRSGTARPGQAPLNRDAAGDPPASRAGLNHDPPAVGELNADGLGKVPGTEQHTRRTSTEAAVAPPWQEGITGHGTSIPTTAPQPLTQLAPSGLVHDFGRRGPGSPRSEKFKIAYRRTVAQLGSSGR